MWCKAISIISLKLEAFMQSTNTPPKFNIAPLIFLPKSKGSSSNHPFSRATLNLGGVSWKCHSSRGRDYWPPLSLRPFSRALYFKDFKGWVALWGWNPLEFHESSTRKMWGMDTLDFWSLCWHSQPILAASNVAAHPCMKDLNTLDRYFTKHLYPNCIHLLEYLLLSGYKPN